MKNRGVSQLIATVLLIVLVIIIAIIILLWARGFVKEAITKNNEAIELTCRKAEIKAQYSTATNTVIISNEGNIPVYGAVIKMKKRWRTKVSDVNGVMLAPGDSGEVYVGDVSNYKTLIVVPVLLGKTESGKNKVYTCPDSTGVIIKLAD